MTSRKVAVFCLVLALFVLTPFSFSFVIEQNVHCMVPQLDNALTTTPSYDQTANPDNSFPVGTKMTLTFGKMNAYCDDQALQGAVAPFVALYNSSDATVRKDSYLVTNSCDSGQVGWCSPKAYSTVKYCLFDHGVHNPGHSCNNGLISLPNSGGLQVLCRDSGGQVKIGFCAYIPSTLYKTVPSGAFGADGKLSQEICGNVSEDFKVGSGNDWANNTVEYTFAEAGTYKMKLKYGLFAIAGAPIPGEGEANFVWRDSQEIVVNVVEPVPPSRPSLLIFGPAQTKAIRHFEQTGGYNETIYFILVNNSGAQETTTTFSCTASNGVTCVAPTEYNGWPIENGGSLIVPLKLTFAKSNSPITSAVSLNVNYLFNGSNPESASISSSPIDYTVGLLDQQDFQAEVKVAAGQNECIGFEGLVGRTGEEVDPQVNLVHGGSTGGGAISIDECDSSNSNYVYCMQSEFLVELANKIAKVAEIRTDQGEGSAEEAQYMAFSSYVRDQQVSAEEITKSLGIINSFLSNSGVNANVYGATNADKFARLSALYNAAKISVNGNYMGFVDAGSYDVAITVSRSAPPSVSGSDCAYVFGDTCLSGSTAAVDPKLQIEIKLTGPVSKPALHWFFYDSDFNSDGVSNNISMYNEAFTNFPYATNVLKSGYLLEYMEGGEQNLNRILYNTFAIPIFIRINAGGAGTANSSFNVSGDWGTPFNGKDTFSYWTGFASSVKNGCGSIVSPGVDPLPYREPDAPIAGTQFELDKFKAGLIPDSNIYLETVLYLPVGAVNQSLDFKPSSPSVSAFYKGEGALGSCTSTGAACSLSYSNTSASFVSSLNTDKISILKDILNKIKTKDVCVAREMSGTGSPKWIVFWNQQKVLATELAGAKTAVVPANQICAAEIVG